MSAATNLNEAITSSVPAACVWESDGRRSSVEAQVARLLSLNASAFATPADPGAYTGAQRPLPLTGKSGDGHKRFQCSGCSGQELLSISGTELLVYERKGFLRRRCSRCLEETSWREAENVHDAELLSGRVAMAEAITFLTPTRKPSLNERKYSRTQLKDAKAGIQGANGPLDIVKVLDVSRGGLRFLSQVDYRVGTEVQVAVPYIEGNMNIFVRGKIVRVQCRTTPDFPGEFAIQYIR